MGMEKSSCPVSCSEDADWPSMYWRGMMPIPMRLLRWMRSKLSAMTARIP